MSLRNSNEKLFTTNMNYMPVRTWSEISSDLLWHAMNAKDWVEYYNFTATPIPVDILARDKFLVKLAGKRKFHAGILKMDPNTCYNWHVDSDRKVGLNMLLLDDEASRCFFADGQIGVVTKTEELKYVHGKYYVFNTQVPHMVINTTEPRYLFSVEFLDEDRGLTFDELCEDVKGMNHGY